jgi:hypothetical protein
MHYCLPWAGEPSRLGDVGGEPMSHDFFKPTRDLKNVVGSIMSDIQRTDIQANGEKG